jgi:hypothetical protein
MPISLTPNTNALPVTTVLSALSRLTPHPAHKVVVSALLVITAQLKLKRQSLVPLAPTEAPGSRL